MVMKHHCCQAGASVYTWKGQVERMHWNVAGPQASWWDIAETGLAAELGRLGGLIVCLLDVAHRMKVPLLSVIAGPLVGAEMCR